MNNIFQCINNWIIILACFSLSVKKNLYIRHNICYFHLCYYAIDEEKRNTISHTRNSELTWSFLVISQIQHSAGYMKTQISYTQPCSSTYTTYHLSTSFLHQPPDCTTCILSTPFQAKGEATRTQTRTFYIQKLPSSSRASFRFLHGRASFGLPIKFWIQSIGPHCWAGRVLSNILGLWWINKKLYRFPLMILDANILFHPEESLRVPIVVVSLRPSSWVSVWSPSLLPLSPSTTPFRVVLKFWEVFRGITSIASISDFFFQIIPWALQVERIQPCKQHFCD